MGQINSVEELDQFLSAPGGQKKQQPGVRAMAPPPGFSAPTPKYAKPGPYVTQLAPEQESQFQSWVKQNNIPWQDSPTADYDMRGFWKAQTQGDKRAKRASNKHFPDTWKTPYHETFSNESQYATPAAPHWEGDALVPSAAFPEPIGPKPTLKVTNVQELDSFLKSPTSKYDLEHRDLHMPSDFERDASTVGKFVPEWATGPIKKEKEHFADPFKRGQEAIQKRFGEAAESVAAHPGQSTAASALIPGLDFAHRVISPDSESERAAFEQAHPIVAGAAKHAGENVAGIATDPTTWLFMAAGGPVAEAAPTLSRLIDLGFTAQMGVGTARAVNNIRENWASMSPMEKAGAITDAGISGAFTALGALSAVHEHPESEQARMVNELANDTFRKDFKKLDPHQQAQVLYNIASKSPSPITMDAALRMVKTPPKFDLLPEAQRMAEQRTQARKESSSINRDLGERAVAGMQPPPVFEPEKRPSQAEAYELPATESAYMSPEERSQQYYTLESARARLDAERQRQQSIDDQIKAADTQRQREAADRRLQAEGEAGYRAAREGKIPVVKERRGLQFDIEGAEENKAEFERLSGEMDRIAQEHLYTDGDEMLISIDQQKGRGRKLEDWQRNILDLNTRRIELKRLSDPRSLAPKQTEVFASTLEDANKAIREQEMRDAATKIGKEATNVSSPEQFEKLKAEQEEAKSRAEDLRTERDRAAAARAAQTAERQVYPLGVPIAEVKGNSGQIILPDRRRLDFHYAVVPLSQLIVSHDPMGNFEPNPDYPEVLQPRDYKNNKETQAGVIAGGANPEPALIMSDTATPTDGPPIVRADGLVAGGNGRTMRMKLAFKNGHGETLGGYLASKAEQFGIDSAKIPPNEEQPVLVRVLDDPLESAEDLFQIGRDLNRGETMGFSEAETAVTAGRALSIDTLDWVTNQLEAMGEEASVRDLMRRRGNDIIERMVNSGMIEPTKRAEFITSDGEMTEKAKDLFENALLGKVIDDAALLATTPKDVLKKLERSIASLARIKDAGGMWDFTPELQEALGLWKKVDSVRDGLNLIGSKDDSLVDKYLRPGEYKMGTSMLIDARDVPHPTVEALAKTLEESGMEVKKRFTEYSNDAEGKQATFGPPPNPVESFNRFIAERVGVDVPSNLWGVLQSADPGESIRSSIIPAEEVQRPAAESEVKPPPPLGGVSEASVRNFLEQHPGTREVAGDLIETMGTVVKNALGMDLNTFLKQNWAGIRAEGDPTPEALSQDMSKLAAWARSAGKKLTVSPFGEQPDLFGGSQKQYMIRRGTGINTQEAMVLQDQLKELRELVPQIREMVDEDGNLIQGKMFDEPPTLGAPEDEPEPPEQSSLLFQEKPSPWLYKSEVVLGDPKMPGSQSGAQWAAMLKNKGVKDDELKWMGIDDFLADKKKVTKEELLDFIRENQLQMQEVVFDEVKYPPTATLDGAGGLVTNARATQYGAWTLPGPNKGYTELLFALPDALKGDERRELRDLQDRSAIGSLPTDAGMRYRELLSRRGDRFMTPHFGGNMPNVLAHVRFDERVDVDGKRVLFIEEVQSDWHQKGKREGYAKDTKGWTAQSLSDPNAGFNHWLINDANGEYVTKIVGGTKEDAIRKAGEGIPDAPFKSDWHEMVMKRMLREAAERGYDRVAWTTGEQTAERYNLAKVVDRIDYYDDGRLVATKKNTEDPYESDEQVVIDRNVPEDQLADVIGKDAAKQLLEQKKSLLASKRVLKTKDMKIGGEWAKNLYDKAIPNFLNKYGKKWGARVGETSLVGEGKGGRFAVSRRGTDWIVVDRSENDTVVDEGFDSIEEAREMAASMDRLSKEYHAESIKVPSLDVTPEMRRSVMEGQPLFQTKKGATEFLEDGKAVVYLFKSADASTFMHEFFHTMRRYLGPQDAKVLEDWLKVKDGRWSRDHEEKAARAFEYYHRETKPSTLPEKVREVFAKIQTAMRQIYGALKGSPLVKPSKEVAALFDRWYGKEMDPPPGDVGSERSERSVRSVGSVTATGTVGEMEESIADGVANAATVQWAPDKERDSEAAMANARKELEAAGWKYKAKEKQFEKNGWYAFLRSQGELSPPILQWAKLATEPVKEKIQPAAEMDAPPLSTEERESAMPIGKAGAPLDTGKVRTKIFKDFEQAKNWSFDNQKNIKGAELSRLPDGRVVVDFTPKNEKVLFQTGSEDEQELAKMNLRIESLNKGLMRMMPEAERAQIIRQLRDVTEKRNALQSKRQMRSLEPPPGQVVTLWTPEGERPVPNQPREETRGASRESNEVRTVFNEPAAVRQLERPPKVSERAESPGLSRTKPSSGRSVSTAGRGSAARGAAGEPRSALRDVDAIRVAPARAREEAAYSARDWEQKVKDYRLPENAPAPTVRIPKEISRMLMPGQTEIVESVLSGLKQHDAFILATTTGTGKTFMSSAILQQKLAENPNARILYLTPSQGLIHGDDGIIQVANNFGVEVKPMPAGEVPQEPGTWAATWASMLNRPDIETQPWDLVIADEVQEARRWFADSQRGMKLKEMGANAKQMLYMSATPFHTALEIGHMDKLGLWKDQGFEQWSKQMGVYRDKEGNLAGGRAPMKLAKLRSQLIERGQMINIDRNMEGYSAHFGVVPMDGQTAQGLDNIAKAMQLAENYFQSMGRLGKIRPTKAQAVTLAKRWLEWQRLPHAIELAKKLENEGWKTILFSENKKEFNEIFEFLQEADEGTGGQISALLPKFGSIPEKLQEAFGDDVAIFAGPHSAAREGEKNSFMSNRKKHLYATYGAGGVGVSLHDKMGEYPRAVIYLGPPWSGVSFDQALGRPWRYGTKSDVRAYFLFSNSAAEMDIITNKVAPRMESLRALVSGVDFEDPVVKNLRNVPDNKEAVLDYEFGNEHKAGLDSLRKIANRSGVTNYAEMPIVSASTAKNRGMKLPGDTGTGAPSLVRLWQGESEDETTPPDFDAPEVTRARTTNISIAEGFIESGSAPGRVDMRSLTPPQRRMIADSVMANAEAAARENPGAATQAVYTAWENAMKQMDAFLSVGKKDGEMEPPPTAPSGSADLPEAPGEINGLRALDMYYLTNGRDVIRNATKIAGVPEIGYKIARNIEQYHVKSGEIAGPWSQRFWKLLSDNKISKEEFKVAALTLAQREDAKPWMEKEIQRLRAVAPMGDRISKAVEGTQQLLADVFKSLAEAGVYTRVYDAASGSPRDVYFSEQKGGPYWMRRYDYDEKHTVVDPESGKEVSFTLRDLTKHEGAGETKQESIIRGMMDRHGLSRTEVEDWLATKRRQVPLAGNIERAREADLPFFRTDPDVVIQYLEDAAELLARKEYFGQDGSKSAGLIAQIPDQKARAITKTIVDSLLSKQRMEPESRMLMRAAADWAVVSKMTFSAIKVLGHPAHGALLTNGRAFMRGILKSTFDYSSARDAAMFAGSINEQVKIEQLAEFGIQKKSLASRMLQANLWQSAYKWGRVASDATARVWMESYAMPALLKDASNQKIRRQLREFLLLDDDRIDRAVENQRWLKSDVDWAAKALSDKVMFTNDPTELPPAWRARAGGLPIQDSILTAVRVATLLKGYQFKTHALLKDAIWDEARQGNFKPLIPFLTVYPVMGQVIWSLTALATVNKKHFQQLLDDKSWTPGAILKRSVEDIAHMIGDSQLMSFLEEYIGGRPRVAADIGSEYFISAPVADVGRTVMLPAEIRAAKTPQARYKAAKRWAEETLPATRPIENLSNWAQPPSDKYRMTPAPHPR